MPGEEWRAAGSSASSGWTETGSTNAEPVELGRGSPRGWSWWPTTRPPVGAGSGGRGRLHPGRRSWRRSSCGPRPARDRLHLAPRAGRGRRVGVSSVAGVEVDLKWPNDLLVADRKLAGILAEIGDGGRPPRGRRGRYRHQRQLAVGTDRGDRGNGHRLATTSWSAARPIGPAPLSTRRRSHRGVPRSLCHRRSGCAGRRGRSRAPPPGPRVTAASATAQTAPTTCSTAADASSAPPSTTRTVTLVVDDPSTPATWSVGDVIPRPHWGARPPTQADWARRKGADGFHGVRVSSRAGEGFGGGRGGGRARRRGGWPSMARIACTRVSVPVRKASSARGQLRHGDVVPRPRR